MYATPYRRPPLRILLCLAASLSPVVLSPPLFAQETHRKTAHRHKVRPARPAAPATGAARPAPAAMRKARSVAPEQLQVVGVTHGTQASAIGTLEQARLMQQMAPNLINVVPQSEIKKVPDFTLGDAARRIPGVSVSNSGGEASALQIRGLDQNLNGVMFEGVMLPAGSINHAGRAVPMEALPAPLAGGLELTKTNRPDQDAYALGGQLNILSRDIAPDAQPFLEIIGGSGFRDPRATPIFDGTISGGMRFGFDGNPFDRHAGGDKPFSVSFFATALSDWLQEDDIQQTPLGQPGYPADAITESAQLYSNGHKVRWGYGGTLGWDVNRHTKLYLKMFDSGLDSPAVESTLDYSLANVTQIPGHPNTYTADATLTQHVNDSWPRNEERMYKFGGDSAIGRFKIDYYGAWASNFHYAGYAYDSQFQDPNTVPVIVDSSNPLRTVIRTTNGVNPTDYSAYPLTRLQNSQQNDTDAAWTGHIGVTTPLDFRAIKGTLGFGGGARFEHIYYNDPGESYANLPAVTAGQWEGAYHYTLLNGFYDIGNPIGTQYVRQLIDQHTYPIVQNVANDAINTLQGYIQDDERIYNLYAQYIARWRRLGVMAGLRYEKTDGVYRGIQTSVTPDGQNILTPRAVGQEYANLFPTVQLRYNLTDNLIARANWSTAIGRPGFNAVTASRTVDYSANAVTEGNPNLKPITGTNYDVDLEYYLPRGGIVSAGAFDKEFKNYVVTYTNYTDNYPGMVGLTTISTYANIPYAFARGFELNYRQQFTFLPGFWSGFGIGGNMTYVLSRGRGRDGMFETLPNTASHLYNFEVFYSRGPLTLQFDGNYSGLKLTGLGSDPTQDSFTQPALNFDIGARYMLSRTVELYFKGRNLTQVGQNDTQGSSARNMVELQYPGSAYIFGVDVKL
ncbi:TonB-dependent receptor [Nguyenibacter sp. L1]|uniref:TonB-dependent receptor n=1 Tax=Nguyenibacter sp. L1 TaxID=3049350 RepID=UPI002B48B341|nr:TonB-dependent receptor [Nguyenibacter sp. L1]WRH89666.1 TonB-dependent receptor [Nguyenibacter sp. L1]